MPSLSDKLKSLGVKIGSQDLSPPRIQNPYTIESVVGGDIVHTPLGETYTVDSFYPPDYLHGNQRLMVNSPLEAIAAWAADDRIRHLTMSEFAFLDTETTGLSGGTGTYAFLVGIARFEQGAFHISQFFMRDPSEEQALLSAIEHFLAPCRALVTYNGKAFDMPLLSTRFVAQGWLRPFQDMVHIDLLHLARRLWRDRLPSRTLGNLEIQILGTSRSLEDVPGWMIPEIYFEYLRSGDARPLQGVFYHNAMDVLSLAALLNHCAWILADPLNGTVNNVTDLTALGKLYEVLGHQQVAADLYRYAIQLDSPQSTQLEAAIRLAAMYKKQDDYYHAIPLWEKLADLHHIEAHVELAKYYEHRLRDYPEAARWTQGAITHVLSSNLSGYERNQWLDKLEYRLERITRKINRKNRK